MAMHVVESGNSDDSADRETDEPPAIDARLVACVAAVAAPLLLVVGLWASTHMQVDAVLHMAALFVHLSCLVVGFGAVLITDYHAMLWLTGRCSLRDVGANAERLHLPIWLGLAGLVLSGLLLKPDLESPITMVKIGLVLLLTLNGLQVRFLSGRLLAVAGRPMTRLEVVWGAGSALISQICWWGATFIGFWNVQH
jgi:hypothetical protein